MRPDIIDLSRFYASPLGLATRDVLRRRLTAIWPDLRGRRLLGLGYAVPYLRPFLAEAERVVALMPASQGVMQWPPEGPNAVALGEEINLPFGDALFDRVLLVHSLESCAELSGLLREMWRLLAPDGRIVIVAPNRRGLWARLESTPFGHGQPFTFTQIERLLRDNLFRPTVRTEALYFPPSNRKLWFKAAAMAEWLGQRWFQTFAGVLIVEASKQIYAVRPLTAPQTQKLAQPDWLPAATRGSTRFDAAVNGGLVNRAAAGTPFPAQAQ